VKELSEAVAALGTSLTRAGNHIAELTDIGGPKPKGDTIDVTNHDSPGGYKEKLMAIIDGGEVSLEGNFISGDTLGQIGLLADMNAKILQAFVITFPNGATWTFNALVTDYETDAKYEDKVSFKATLTISGQPVLGAGSASNNLSALVVTGGSPTWEPVFAAGTYSYIVEITGVSSITVTPTAAAGTITVNGTAVASGSASGAISTPVGVTPITVRVQQSGMSAVTYTLQIARAS
jgi:predicted secreted protein